VSALKRAWHVQGTSHPRTADTYSSSSSSSSSSVTAGLVPQHELQQLRQRREMGR
jgi:hypothetical protein